MKQYPKTYEDLYNIVTTKGKPHARIDKISSTFGSTDVLASRFRSFYKEADVKLFDLYVKHTWLANQFVYDNQRKSHSGAMGFAFDWAYGYFMKSIVGVSQHIITSHRIFFAISSYFKELFPEFLKHDPFVDIEYYKFPFQNISLAHMMFVYAIVDHRMEMLRIAEEKAMPYADFVNWVVNYIFCYNDEVGETVYELAFCISTWPQVRNNRLTKEWRKEVCNFEI